MRSSPVARTLRYKSSLMLHKLISIAAWATLAFIIFATLSPAHLRPELTATEPATVVVFERVGAFAVLGLLFAGGYPRRYALVWVIVLGSAILLELLQILVPDRDARMVDAVEKIAGGGAGIFTAQWLLLFMPAPARGARTTNVG
jgi:VanZ family protein